MKLIIIGNGIAALSAAESFRKYDMDSPVLLLSGDRYPAYYRIKLSHYLGKSDFTEEELYIKDTAWYADRRIEVKLESWVERIDFQHKQVVLADGSRHGYDRLLLANGAHPFVPPLKGTDKKGVFTLRTLDDLKAIHEWMQGKDRVSVIGGGLLGLEAAHGLAELGKHVMVLEHSPYLLPRQLDQELSLVVQRALENEGLRFTLNAECGEVTGDDRVSGIRLADGRSLACETVILSAGVRPNTALYQGTDLAVTRGVVVDEAMRTNLPDVYAAGDIAECHGMVYGLWTAANEQGKVAGANLAGQSLVYGAPQLSASLSIGSVKLFSAGDVADAERVVDYREGAKFHRLYIKGGIVAGAVLTGDTAWMMKARNLVAQQKEVPASMKDGDLFEFLMG